MHLNLILVGNSFMNLMFKLIFINFFISPHGMGERGMGLACGQVMKTFFCNFKCKTILISGSRISKEHLFMDKRNRFNSVFCQIDTKCY